MQKILASIKNTIYFFITFSCAICFITGCGANGMVSLSQNSITIREDHSAYVHLVEDFDTTVYNENDMLAFVDNEISTYNASAQNGTVKLVNHVIEGNTLTMNLEYSSLQALNDNMEGVLFVGTVGDAIDAGIDINVSLYIVGKGISTVGKFDLLEMRDYKLVIVNGKYTVRVPGKITHYSQWMDLLDDYTACPFENKGDRYFIIYK